MPPFPISLVTTEQLLGGLINREEDEAISFHAFGEDSEGAIKSLVISDENTVTFGRASESSVRDFEGNDKTALEDEIRTENARQVRNLDHHDFQTTHNGAKWAHTGTATVGASTGTMEIDGQNVPYFPITFSATGNSSQKYVTDPNNNSRDIEYVGAVWLRVAPADFAVNGNASFRISQYDVSTNPLRNITITDQWQRFSIGPNVLNAAPPHPQTLNIRNFDGQERILECCAPLSEKVDGQTNKNPSEGSVTVGVLSADEYLQFANIDGVRYFAYENGNTIDGDGIVTEAKGTALTAWRSLFEPSSKNYSDDSDDLSGGAETIDLTAEGTGDFTLSVSGTAAVTVAAGTATGTGFGQATAGNPITFNLSITGTVTLTLDSGSLNTMSGGAVVKQVEPGALASSFIPTAGSPPVIRAADNPSSMFDYSNFNISKGTFIFDLTMAAAVDQGIINFANAEAGLVSYDTTNEFQTDDGTNQASVDPSLSSNLGDTIRFAVLYDSDDGLTIGYKNITDTGAWVWDTDSAAFDGDFATDSVFNLLYDLATVTTLKNLKYYKANKGKIWVEANN